MDLEQAKQAVAELIAAVYPANMHQIIMNSFSQAPNSGDPSYWENIRQGLAMQASGTVEYGGQKKEEGDWSVEVSNNTVKITGYKGNDTVLQIPSQILGLPVTKIGRRAFRDKNLANVTIPDSVKSIEDDAFLKNRLSGVTLGSGIESIGESAFAKNQLANINLPAGLKSIGKEAFAGNMLGGLTIPNGVTSIGDAAFNENAIAVITIPAGITSIGGSVFMKNQIAELTIPASLNSIGDWAFSDNQIADIAIPDNITSVGKNAFRSNKLTLVTVPDSLANIGEDAFGDATVVRKSGTVVVEGKAAKDFEVSPAEDGKSVIITGFLKGYTKNLPIPPLINGLPISGIAAKAFYKKSAVNVTVPDSVTFIGDEAFAGSMLESINIPAGVTSIGKRAFAESKIAAISIPDSVKSIGDSAFEECGKLADVTLGGGITSIGANVFRRCHLGAGIIIPAGVTSIGEKAFFQSRLSSLTVLGNVKSVGESAFEQCALSNITIQGSVEGIGKKAFSHNETAEGDLMVLYADDIKSIIVTDYKGKEKKLTIPPQIRGLPVPRIYQGVLSSGISGITIPDNVVIGGGISTAGHKMRSITIGKNVTIEGDYFDLISLEDFVQQRKKIHRNDDGTITEELIGNAYIPFSTAYKEKGCGTFTLAKDETGMDQWVFKTK